MRILVTSDLHPEVTGAETIRRLVAGIDRESPDAVVLAGDLGNPSHLFESCLAAFLCLECPVAVVPGNHDVWTGNGETSIRLYEELLPEITRSMGFHWLEKEPLILGDGIAIAGSIGWYDYSAADPAYGLDDEEIIRQKPRFAMDAMRVDWEHTDKEFAGICRTKLQRQILGLQENPQVERILLATHVPIFEQQIERESDDPEWALGNPYFGHLTMGEMIRGYSKIHWVVSGHTHVGVNGVIARSGMAPIATAVVPSDYERPRWLTVDT